MHWPKDLLQVKHEKGGFSILQDRARGVQDHSNGSPILLLYYSVSVDLAYYKSLLDLSIFALKSNRMIAIKYSGYP